AVGRAVEKSLRRKNYPFVVGEYERRRQHSPCVDLPNFVRHVGTGGDQTLAVGQEGDRPNTALVAAKGSNFRASAEVPQGDVTIRRARDGRSSVAGKNDSVNPGGRLCLELADRPAGL